MKPLRTTVVGSYPFAGWLEFASAYLDPFGADDIAEMQVLGEDSHHITRQVLTVDAGGSLS